MVATYSGTRRMRMLVAWVFISLLSALPVSAAEDARSGIEAVNKQFEGNASRGDTRGMAALYTAESQLLPPQGDFVNGRQAIGEFWQGVLDSGVAGVSLVTVEVESHGNTASEVGTFELLGADGKAVDQGKYIVIWKMEGDSWKLHRDIWNSSVVPAGP